MYLCLHRQLYQLCYAVYNKCGYVDLVSHAAEESMQAAVEEIHSLPGYEDRGEVKIWQ